MPALPQERENHSLRFEPSDVQVVVRLMANDTESATAMRIKILFGTVIMLTLFPGERAGVRAVVNLIPLETVSITRF
jgi:hypothetical protein